MKFNILSVLLFIGITATAQVFETKTEIENVTVFLNGAQITRTGSFNASGKQTVKLTGLSPFIKGNSVQVKSSGSAQLVDISFGIDYNEPKNKPKRIQEIEDSLETLNDTKSALQNTISVYEDERRMILANQNIKGQEAMDVLDLQEVSNFYRSRLSDILSKIHVSKIQIRKIDEVLTRLNNSKRTISYQQGNKTGTIEIEFFSIKKEKIEFEVSYYTSGATWEPFYDIRAKDTKSPLSIAYKANVRQWTGIDWEDVNLTLSTGNPSLSGQAPELYKWVVKNHANNYRNNSYGKKDKRLMEYKAVDIVSLDGYESEDLSVGNTITEKMVRTDTHQQIATSAENTTTVEYKVKVPYSISSDNKKQKIEIDKKQIDVFYEYITVPKKDKTAYLTANIGEWEDLSLLSGKSNIFFGDAFIGAGYIDGNSTDDTLAISLGRDQKINVERKKLKEKTKKKLLGGTRTQTISVEVTVKNTKKETVNINIKDQIPVSNDNQIKIELLENKEGKLDADSGIIDWQLELQPGEVKKVIFTYEVKYPKSYRCVLE